MFQASHTLLATTNYIPIVNETDWGTWRRFALLRFPYTFRKPEQELRPGTNDRPGDSTLKSRIRRNQSDQHDAIVTWAVEGSIRYHAEVDTALKPTERIEADTLAWRAEADRILGFWKEWLTPDPSACILARELHQVFNAWLAGNGHGPWAKETFGPRFKQHDETTEHRVKLIKTSRLENLSRPPMPQWAYSAVPGRPDVYTGLRFKNPTEDEHASD